jgi:NADPH2:quinone reductase
MKTVVITRFGGPEVLEICDMPVPQPGDQQVLLQVDYAGVNGIDLLERQGTQALLPLPFIPGHEVAGTILALGEGVEGLHVGQSVTALTAGGGYAEFVLAQAALTFPLDAFAGKIALEQAAAFPTVALTAYGMLTRAARLRAGESVLIHSASGGIGIAAGQIAHALAARLVLGTVGTREKEAYARASGYDQIFPVDDFEQAVMEATNGKGVDLVLDARGEPTRSRSLGVLAPFGRLVVFGNVSGNPEKFISPHELWYSNKAVVGYSITALSKTTPYALAEIAHQALQLMADGALTLAVSEVLPLEQAAEAHRRSGVRSHVGKLLLQVR